MIPWSAPELKTGAIAALWAAVILASTGGLFTLSVTAAQSAPGNSSFEAALAQVEAAQVELARKRPEPYKGLWSRRDDVTLRAVARRPVS